MPVMQNLELRLVPNFFSQLKLVFESRENRIPFHLAFDEREVKVGTARQCLLVNLRTAADEDVVRKFRRIQ